MKDWRSLRGSWVGGAAKRQRYQAAAENADSRILIGFHFRKVVEEGTEYGRKIGKRAANCYLRPVR